MDNAARNQLGEVHHIMQPHRILITAIILATAMFWVGCDSRPKWRDVQGGLHLVLKVESSSDARKDEDNIARIMRKMDKRLNDFGIKTKFIARERDRFIVAQLPPVKDRQRISSMIVRSAVLEFKLVDEEHSVESALQGNVPEGLEILYQIGRNKSTGQIQKIPFLVKQKALLSGDYLADAEVQIDSQFNAPYVAISFVEEGAKMFEQITGKNVNRRLAIILDNRILSAPVIREKIAGGKAHITGHFTIEEAKDAAIALNNTYPAQTHLAAVQDLTEALWLGNRKSKGK